MEGNNIIKEQNRLYDSLDRQKQNQANLITKLNDYPSERHKNKLKDY